jgi:ATP-dependent exoDNAse (exonuclease V) alpha subunit
VPKIIQMIKERMPRRFGLDPMKDVQVLCPMNRGVLGARNLNIQLQEVLNPNPPAKVERFGWRFSPGDRVMETQNDYDREVFNGDLGMVVRIDDEEGALIASFRWREVSYPFGELDTLVPAYATTIHKSQGSEYPAVIIPVVTQHFTMLARNLLYTGVTRGKRLVVLVGSEEGCRDSCQRRADEEALDETAGVDVSVLTFEPQRLHQGRVPHDAQANGCETFGQSRLTTAIHSPMIRVSSEKSSPCRVADARYHAPISERHQSSVRSPSP